MTNAFYHAAGLKISTHGPISKKEDTKVTASLKQVGDVGSDGTRFSAFEKGSRKPPWTTTEAIPGIMGCA